MLQLLSRLATSVRRSQDPTKTTVLRKRYERDLVRRFRAVQALIKEEVVDNDALALNARFDFPTKSQKVNAFMRWLKTQNDAKVLEIIPGTPKESAAQRAWQNIYLRSAYQKGLAGAGNELRAGGVEVTQRWIDAGFFRPIHADSVGLIYTRAYSDLEGITQAQDTKISRILAQGLTEGRSAAYIAKEIAGAIDSVGIVRARMLARTEVIRAHAEATLNTYDEAGILGVHVASEFSTAGDENVCPKCEELEGEEFTIEEARGVIPVHPNCRCSWLPVVRNPRGTKLL